jgi:glucose uptake protein
MILPTTYVAALMLTIVSLVCWGSWANTFKMARKWRFELFYFDYAFGVAVAAAIAAFTFGSMGDELSVSDNFLIAGKKHMAYALVAGGIFNLANMLLVAAISIAGLAVAFPVGIGLALVIGVFWNYLLRPAGSPAFLFGGVALVVVAIIVDAMAYREHGLGNKALKTKFSVKGLILSLVSGVLMGSFYPLVEMSRATEVGLGPYTAALLFAAGVLITTFVYNLYFMNLPVQGEPVGFGEYFSGGVRNHLLGLVGGILWCVGAISNFVAASAPPEVNVSPAMSYAMGQGATLVSALWGLLVWKEFAGATPRVRMLLTVMIVLFVVGLGLISVAPLYGEQQVADARGEGVWVAGKAALRHILGSAPTTGEFVQ